MKELDLKEQWAHKNRIYAVGYYEIPDEISMKKAELAQRLGVGVIRNVDPDNYGSVKQGSYENKLDGEPTENKA